MIADVYSHFTEEAVEFSHKYSDKSTDQLIDIYRESPEYRDCMDKLGGEVFTLEPAVNFERSKDFEEHTYPTSKMYAFYYMLIIMIFYFNNETNVLSTGSKLGLI